jgi:uncharacterized protein with HEPN domain
MKDDKLYLIHISECIERIESYVGQMDAQAFAGSTMVQDAILRNLQTMAESTQRLSDKAKESQPQIDWYKIAGFRNILVHDYLGIDTETIWNIIKKDLPALKEAVTTMMG